VTHLQDASTAESAYKQRHVTDKPTDTYTVNNQLHTTRPPKSQFNRIVYGF